MLVREVVELAREWVKLEGSKTPGFYGAHLMGSLVTMPREALFPLWRDVDLALVVPNGNGSESGIENMDLLYKGLILEVSFHEQGTYRSPEEVLSRPGRVHCFVADSTLLDPSGMLRALHTTVAKEYARRQWVLARVDWEKTAIREDIRSAESAKSWWDGLVHLAGGLVYLAGLPAVAALKLPTNRRCLVLMRQVLDPLGRTDLLEELLHVWGVATMTRSQTEGYLEEAMQAFDRAVEVYHTPFPYSFKLHGHVRPYFVEGTRDMVRKGHHREAVWWIWLYHWLASVAIQNDAPEQEKPTYRAGYNRFLDALGFGRSEDLATRVEQARALAEKVFQVADEIVAQNPEIVD